MKKEKLSVSSIMQMTSKRENEENLCDFFTPRAHVDILPNLNMSDDE
jgi:hypothetical protein